MRAIIVGFAAIAAVTSGLSGDELPANVKAVQKYVLEKDYPEIFGEAHYKTKVRNAVVADLDGDGEPEVVIHSMPHYRQSPPLVIYRVTHDLVVSRVKEGLAPGPLVPLTGEYLDSHTLGQAADLDLRDKQHDAKARRDFVARALGKGSSIVEYRDFFHLDTRTGSGTYIDMTGLAVQPKEPKCEFFEFAPVREVSAGTVAALGGGNLLAAWAGDKVYLYRIKAFLPSGLIDKESWEVTPMPDFHGFASGVAGPLRTITAAGKESPFAVSCKGHHCKQVP